MKRILSVFLSVLMLASLLIPAMGVSANVDTVDITDYTPVMPDSLTYGEMSNGAYGNGAYGIKFENTADTGWKWSSVAQATREEAPSDYMLASIGGVWKMTSGIEAGTTYVLSFKVKNKSPEGIIPNCVYGLWDGSVSGDNKDWIGQYAYAEEVTSTTDWTTISKTFKVDYNSSAATRIRIGLGSGNTHEAYAGRDNFDFRPNALLQIDDSKLYIAPEAAYDVINEISMTKVMPGATVMGNAKVINQVGDKGNLDQNITYFVTDTEGNVKEGVSVVAGSNGSYTATVDENAADGDYVITARAAAYNTTENFMQQSVTLTVEDVDKYLTEYETVAVDGKALFDGRSEKSQVTGITITDPSAATEHMYVVTADSSRDDSSAPNSFATPAAGVRLFVANGEMLKDTSYVISFRVKNTSPEGVTPNVVFGFLDKSKGGGNPDWNWLGQYTWAEEITTQGEWTTITKRVTLGYNSGANSYLLIGLGAGNTYTQYNGKENYDFRPNASLTIDTASAFIAPEAFYDISASASKNVVRAGASVLVDAKAVNQIGLEGALAQNFSWVALDSTKTDVADGITITPVSGDTSKVNVTFDKDVAEGTYVIAAYSEDYDAVRHIPITVSNKTSIENVAVDTVNKTVTFDAVNVADSGLSGAVFVAEYSGDTYVKAEKASFTLSGGDSVDNEVTYTLVPADGNKIIVYIWDDKLTPYVQPIEK